MRSDHHFPLRLPRAPKPARVYDDDVDRDHPCYREATLTERPMKLEPLATPYLAGKKSKRVRRNQWVPR